MKIIGRSVAIAAMAMAFAFCSSTDLQAQEIRFPVGSEATGSPYYISQSFQDDPFTYKGREISGHLGEDWAVPIGTAVYPIAGGVVVRSRDYGGEWGHVIIIRHDDLVPDRSVYSLYAHLLARLVPEEGSKAIITDISRSIGKSGIKGTGPHLHFEIKDYGDAEISPGHAYSQMPAEDIDVLILEGVTYFRPSSFLLYPPTPPPVSDIFTRISDMTTPRYNHCAVRLKDGRVLIAGGNAMSRSFSPLRTAEIYNPRTRTFSPSSNIMAVGRGRQMTCTLLTDGKVLIAGGETIRLRYTDTAELYDPATDTFTAVGRMTSVRGEAWSAFALEDGDAIMLGGTFEGNFGTATESVDRYSGTTRSFTQVGTLLGARRDYTAQRISATSIILIGGYQRFDQFASPVAEIYDLETNTSRLPEEQPSEVPRGRDSSSALLPNGDVLLTTGGGLKAEIFRRLTDRFEGVLEAPTYFAGDFVYSTALSDGRVLLLGYGRESTARGRIAEMYDPLSGDFFSLGSFAVSDSCQDYTSTLLEDGTVLIAGGSTRDGGACGRGLAVAEIFTPPRRGVRAVSRFAP